MPKENPRFDPGYKGAIDFTKCYWTFEKTRPLTVRSKSGRYEDVYLIKTKPTEGDNYDVQFYPDDVRHMIALYDGEIANADALIGGLLDDIAELAWSSGRSLSFTPTTGTCSASMDGLCEAVRCAGRSTTTCCGFR